MAPSHRSGAASSRRLNSCGMRASQRGQDSGDDLVDAEPRGVDGDVGLPVERPAGTVELLDLRHRAALQHRPVADPGRAGVQLAQVAVEPHDGAEGAQLIHPTFATRRPAAGRDDLARLQRERVERLGLELAEPRLTRLGEDLGDRATLAGRDHVVGLDEAPPEPSGEQPTTHRFSGTHESHQHDVVLRHLPGIVSDRARRTARRRGYEWSCAPQAVAGLGPRRPRRAYEWRTVPPAGVRRYAHPAIQQRAHWPKQWSTRAPAPAAGSREIDFTG